MALTKPSLFLYGFQVTADNRSLDFKSVSGGPEKQATLAIGYYSLSGLVEEIKRALEAADQLNTYTVTANRNIAGGTQNRVSISTSGVFLSILFGTGSRVSSSCATLIGFLAADYTGNTSYTGSSSSGTAFVTNFAAYNYLPPEAIRRNFGSLNVTASGTKEAIVYATQKFFQAQFKYIPESEAFNQWTLLMTWMISQRRLDFTPEVTNPTLYYDCTLESTGEDGKGLAYKLTEMLPKFPNLYDTGIMRFRLKE